METDTAYAADTPDAADTPYAGIVTRGIGFVLDLLILTLSFSLLAAIAALAASLISAFPGLDTGSVVIGGAVYALLAVLYFCGWWASVGQTPGMWWMRVAVTRLDGRRVGWGAAIVRFVGTIISIPLLLGFIPILFSARRRSVPDFMARTVVRYRPEERDLDLARERKRWRREPPRKRLAQPAGTADG